MEREFHSTHTEIRSNLSLINPHTKQKHTIMNKWNSFSNRDTVKIAEPEHHAEVILPLK